MGGVSIIQLQTVVQVANSGPALSIGSITVTEMAAFSFVSFQKSSKRTTSISYFPAFFGAVIVHLYTQLLVSFNPLITSSIMAVTEESHWFEITSTFMGVSGSTSSCGVTFIE
jgi:hypothetical protein